MRFSPSARACRLTFLPMLRIMKAPKGVFFMRHAWLIITHGNFEILEKQLRFLDSENADFFIHVDARVKDFDFAHVRSIPRKSRVTFLERKPISWGHFSQVDCELRLLCAAARAGILARRRFPEHDVGVFARFAPPGGSGACICGIARSCARVTAARRTGGSSSARSSGGSAAVKQAEGDRVQKFVALHGHVLLVSRVLSPCKQHRKALGVGTGERQNRRSPARKAFRPPYTHSKETYPCALSA